MLCQQKSLRVIADLFFVLGIVIYYQRLRIIDQQLQRHAAKVFEQFLDGLIDRIRILPEGETYRFLPRRRQDHGKAVDLPCPAANRHHVFRPVKLGLVPGWSFDPDCGFGTDPVDIFVHFLQESVDRPYASRVADLLQLTKNAGTTQFGRVTAPLNDPVFVRIKDTGAFFPVVGRLFFQFEKPPYCVSGNAEDLCGFPL